MIIETKTYWIKDGTPKDEDIKEALELAKEYNCRIDLWWHGPGYKWYPSEVYHRFIDPDSNFEEIKAMLPKIYGM